MPWKQFKALSSVCQLPKYRHAKGEKLLTLPKCPRPPSPAVSICMSKLKSISLQTMRRLTLDHTETSRLAKMLQKFWTGPNEVRLPQPRDFKLPPDDGVEKYRLVEWCTEAERQEQSSTVKHWHKSWYHIHHHFPLLIPLKWKLQTLLFLSVYLSHLLTHSLFPHTSP